MPIPDAPRVILGLWQLARGHGSRADDPMRVLEGAYGAGFRAFDCADIYTGVEAAIGAFVEAHGLVAGDLRVHTKLVPDLAALPTFGPDDVRRSVDRSRARLGLETLDLVQFHWWDTEVPGCLPALDALTQLRDEGFVRSVGITNFDAEHVRAMVDHGVPVDAIQVQYSLLDRRPRGALTDVAHTHGIDLLAYGTVAGGLLTDACLGAGRLPDPPENRSLVKYALIVDEVGGWDALGSLLGELRRIADDRGADIATVASAYTLAQPGVRSVILGTRSLRHLTRHEALRQGFGLADAELDALESVRARFPEVPGPVYALERDRSGRHGSIMKYGLNEATS